MEQKVLNEEQMREYIENEVRMALLAEGIDETLDEGPILDKIMGFLTGSRGLGLVGNYIKEHMNIEDLISFAIGIFGVAPIVRWLCGRLGISVEGPIGKLIVTALSGLGSVAIGDVIQARAGSNNNVPAIGAGSGNPGTGGNTSPTGGSGYQGGGFGSGGR